MPHKLVSPAAHYRVWSPKAVDGTSFDTEARKHVDLLEEGLTGRILGAAIEVHTALGAGLLESTYEECLCYELGLRGTRYERQVVLPVLYKDVTVACGYRVDVIVEHRVVLELKSVERILAVHEAQLLTYVRVSGIRVGLLLNFNVSALKHGNRQTGSLTPRRSLRASVPPW